MNDTPMVVLVNVDKMPVNKQKELAAKIQALVQESRKGLE